MSWPQPIVPLQLALVKKIFALQPWRSFLPGIGSARSPPMKNNPDIPATDTTEIKQLINRLKQGELDQGDAQLIEKLLNILLTIISLLQRKRTSIRRMKELLFGIKEKSWARTKPKTERRRANPWLRRILRPIRRRRCPRSQLARGIHLLKK